MPDGKRPLVANTFGLPSGKSFLVSVYFPAWFLGNFPDKKVLMVSHTTDLAVDFGRKVRNLVDQDMYKEILMF